MYTAFYGLREKPFSLTPNPRFLYLTDAHKEALAHLLYGLEEGEGFIVLSGEVGTGKTTLCRSLLERIETETELAILFNPSENARELLQSINEEFGLPVEGLSRRQLLSSLNRFLLECNSQGRRVVLIIDEAQNLSLGTLEQVRLLSNLETAANKLIQIILLGQPELDDKLDSNELRQLRQRVSVRWRLEPMDASETGRYIQHRLDVASEASRSILTKGAMSEIHRRTGGVPRLVNALADRTLLAGFAAGRLRLGPRWVRQAAREIPGVRQSGSSLGASRVWVPGAAAAALALAMVGYFAWSLWPEESMPPVAVAETASDVDSPEREALLSELLAEADERTDEPFVVIIDEDATAEAEELAFEQVRFEREIPVSALAVASAPPGFKAPVAPTEFLSALLLHTDQEASLQAASQSLMERHGVPIQEVAPTTVAEALDAMRDAGLGVAEFEGEDLAGLLALNYPALVELRTDAGELRVVAILAQEGPMVEIAGVREGGPLSVSAEALADHFTGLAWVGWRSYLELPELIGEGERGKGVLWIQQSLARLGYGDMAITGFYDQATAAGVEYFQQAHGIRVDGLAGPFTQMLIYGELEEYSPPRLDGNEDGGAG
ncbi:MAG: AAA family ATPase [Myxococcota bacterium]|nr:AAA family ATPase [Myxococcota bacterium]